MEWQLVLAFFLGSPQKPTFPNQGEDFHLFNCVAFLACLLCVKNTLIFTYKDTDVHRNEAAYPGHKIVKGRVRI